MLVLFQGFEGHGIRGSRRCCVVALPWCAGLALIWLTLDAARNPSSREWSRWSLAAPGDAVDETSAGSSRPRLRRIISSYVFCNMEV